ncbi:hypothetical protein ABZ805_28105 [Saccharopolyspora sp. NPDC047091]|uniref:hypothetical protein n=1 Tax=Saccharopolyspora sp. NPDC047091 TaxID=3155924 RepID=UPI00340B23B3
MVGAEAHEAERDSSAGHSRRRQVIALVVAPILFGVLAGVALKWSVVAWWTMQGLGAVGAVFAGREHKYGWSAALRGIVAGLIATSVVIGMHALLPGADVEALALPSYLFEAAAASAVLHLIGAAPGRIRRRAAQVSARLRTR